MYIIGHLNELEKQTLCLRIFKLKKFALNVLDSRDSKSPQTVSFSW